VIHPLMVGTINVVSGTGDTQKQIDKRGKAEQKKWVAEGVEAKEDLERTRFVKRNTDGSRTHTVQMGTTTEHVDVLAFAPAPTRIRAGDSVKFVNNSLAPHTATMVGEQPPITDPLSPQAETAIPGPSPQTLNATALFNTGLLPPKAPGPPDGKPPPKAVRSYTWVVPDKGTYPYYCVLHTQSGMGTEIRAS
jgi:plastocyanin